jgi:hypothetical protein
MTTKEMLNICIEDERALNQGKERTSEMRILQNLRNACDVFSHKTWSHIRNLYQSSQERGFIAILNPNGLAKTYVMGEEIEVKKETLKIMTYYIASRITITVKNENGDYITLMGADDDSSKSRAGLHAIGCDVDVALDMLENITRDWCKIKDNFNVDKNISLI